MNVIQTFKSSTVRDNYGWLSAEYHWMCWALSVLKGKEFFKKMVLYTDDLGKEIIIDKLELPYSKVNLTLQSVDLSKYPSQLWAFAKLYVYSVQTKPFIHLDGDLFFGDDFNDNFSERDLFVQNIEKNIYYNVLEEINKYFDYVPEFLNEKHFEENIDFFSINAGIIGGKNIGFFKLYVSEATDFINRNIHCLEKLGHKLKFLNIIFEQLFFYHLSRQKGIALGSYLTKPVSNPMYLEVIDIYNYPNTGLIHVVSGYKQDLGICQKIAKILYQEYPNYYYKVLKTLSEYGYPLYSKFYQLVVFDNNGKMSFRQNVSEILQSFSVLNEYEHIAHTYLKSMENVNESNELYKSLKSDAKKYDRIINKFYRKNTSDTDYLLEQYHQQKKYYLFNEIINEKRFETSVFIFNKEINCIETAYNWSIIKQNASINFEDENRRSTNFVLLLFKVEDLRILPYYLSNLECVICEILEKEQSLNNLMIEVIEYFNKEEVEKEYESFKKMVLDTLKQLIKLNVIIEIL